MTGLLLAMLIAAAPPPTITFAGDVFWVHERSPSPAIGDAVVANFEGGQCPGDAARPGGRLRSGKWRLCQSPNATRWLRPLGVRALSVENNHARDGDPYALRGAMRYVRIDPLRAGESWERFGVRVLAGRLVEAQPRSRLLREVKDAVAAAPRRAERVVVFAHRGRANAGEALDELARFGPELVIGVGGHEAGRVRRVGRTWVFDDLGDLVMDCACSDGRYGMLVDLPGVEGEPVVVRLVHAAHKPDDVVGAPVAAAIAEQVLGKLSAGQPGARVVDGRLELAMDEPSELQRPVPEPTP